MCLTSTASTGQKQFSGKDDTHSKQQHQKGRSPQTNFWCNYWWWKGKHRIPHPCSGIITSDRNYYRYYRNIKEPEGKTNQVIFERQTAGLKLGGQPTPLWLQFSGNSLYSRSEWSGRVHHCVSHSKASIRLNYNSRVRKKEKIITNSTKPHKTVIWHRRHNPEWPTSTLSVLLGGTEGRQRRLGQSAPGDKTITLMQPARKPVTHHNYLLVLTSFPFLYWKGTFFFLTRLPSLPGQLAAITLCH